MGRANLSRKLTDLALFKGESRTEVLTSSKVASGRPLYSTPWNSTQESTSNSYLQVVKALYCQTKGLYLSIEILDEL